MTAAVAVLVPVLGRPHRVAPLLESIRSATPRARVLFIASPEDGAEVQAIEAEGGEFITVAAGYAGKINAGVRATSEPLVFLGADDLRFHAGWFGRAHARMRGVVQVVGVNDLCSRRVRMGRHATHFLMTREYALLPCADGSPGPLHEGYHHSWVDDECVATARARGVIAFATDSHVEHLHPTVRKAPMDATYVRGRERFEEDRALFRSRAHLWT